MKPLILESDSTDNHESLRAELRQWASGAFDQAADDIDDLEVFTRKDDSFRAVLIGKAPGLVALMHSHGVLLVDGEHFESEWGKA